jgi:hypothetical protein
MLLINDVKEDIKHMGVLEKENVQLRRENAFIKEREKGM